MDEKVRREKMEAFENRGMSSQGGREPGLHRIDRAAVAEILSGEDAAGFARLQVMLDSVIGQLVAVDETRRASG
jgi:hypothetical protein